MTDGLVVMRGSGGGSGEVSVVYDPDVPKADRPRVLVEYHVQTWGTRAGKRPQRRRMRLSSIAWHPRTGWLTLSGPRIHLATGEEVRGQWTVLAGPIETRRLDVWTEEPPGLRSPLDVAEAIAAGETVPTCPVCGAYPFGCVRGCTARSPWGSPDA